MYERLFFSPDFGNVFRNAASIIPEKFVRFGGVRFFVVGPAEAIYPSILLKFTSKS